jgi:hypothetical protein
MASHGRELLGEHYDDDHLAYGDKGTRLEGRDRKGRDDPW